MHMKINTDKSRVAALRSDWIIGRTRSAQIREIRASCERRMDARAEAFASPFVHLNYPETEAHCFDF